MTGATEPSDLENVLAGLNRLIRRRLRAGLRPPRLRGAEIELLRLVRERPGLRVSEAAKELGLAGNSVSTLVKGLVELGMLERSADPSDGRATLLRVTPEADRRLREWQERRSALVRGHVDRLSEEDRAALTAALPALRALAASLHEEAEFRAGSDENGEAELADDDEGDEGDEAELVDEADETELIDEAGPGRG